MPVGVGLLPVAREEEQRGGRRAAGEGAVVRKGKPAHAISPVALEAAGRIYALFDIERGLIGLPLEARLEVRFLSPRLLHSTNAIIDACCDAWMRLVSETDRIKSLCSYPRIEKVAS
jgi:hypothetical protein